tara:strand:- start:192 stop:542 length:351 start_codon:yes stop_codon:yes gene_type:complete
MAINKKSLSHRIIDNVFGFIFKNFNRLIWSVQGKIGRWICPENDRFHFYDGCLCERYCYEHGRDEIIGCSVCEILEFNYKDYPLETLEDLFLKVKNGFYSFEDGCEYNSDEYKYLA